MELKNILLIGRRILLFIIFSSFVSVTFLKGSSEWIINCFSFFNEFFIFDSVSEYKSPFIKLSYKGLKLFDEIFTKSVLVFGHKEDISNSSKGEEFIHFIIFALV